MTFSEYLQTIPSRSQMPEELDIDMLENTESPIITSNVGTIAKAIQSLEATSKINFEIKKVQNNIAKTAKIIMDTSFGMRLAEEEEIKSHGLYLNGFNTRGPLVHENHFGLTSTSMIPASGKKYSDKEKEALRKLKLKTFWNMPPSTNARNAPNSGTEFEARQKLAAVDHSYRDLLKKRLHGGIISGKTNPISGFGLSHAEYKELMTNDSLFDDLQTNNSLLSMESSWSRFGTPYKRDGIIDSGRFSTKGMLITPPVPYESSHKFGLTALGAKVSVNMNLSSFSASPMRSPNYRRQILNLGNEIDQINTFFDPKLTSTINYNIKYINSTEVNRAYLNKHNNWKSQDPNKGEFKRSPIAILSQRFPDFASNMFSVIFSRNIGKYRSPDYYSFDIDNFMARIQGIDVELPALKETTVPFLNRNIAVIENKVNLSHTANLQVRVDQCLGLIKAIYDQAQVEYRDKNFLNSKEINMPNSVYTTYKDDPLTLYVHYELVNSFLPLRKHSDPSIPYDKDVINYQHNETTNTYERIYIFTDVRFLGLDSGLDLAKDGETLEVSLPFTFKEIKEEVVGHKLDKTQL